MRILIAGDTHGPAGLEAALGFAKRHNCDEVLQLGDFYAYDVESDIPVRYIAGNHEDWAKVEATRKSFINGGHYPWLIPDYTRMEYEQYDVGFLGRIVDHAEHRNLMARGVHLGFEPMMWLDKRDGAAEVLGWCNILCFHDKPWMEYEGPLTYGRSYLSDIVREVEPALVLHGHMHEWDINRYGRTTIVSVPPCDPVHFPDEEPEDGTLVLDTDEMTLWSPRHGEVWNEFTDTAEPYDPEEMNV